MAIKRLYDTLVGASVGENQLVQNGDFSDGTTGWLLSNTTIAISNNVATLTPTNANSNIGHIIQIYKGHKYFRCAEFYGSSGGAFINWYGALTKSGSLSGNWITIVDIISNTYDDSSSWRIGIGCNSNSGLNEYKVKNVQVIDLTAMFGSTIADYLYSLETATAGAGIAKLKEWGFLTGEYIPYNPGTLESVEATAHKMVGFNQFDKDSSYYHGASYRYVDIPFGENNLMYMSLTDRDTTIDISDVYIGFVAEQGIAVNYKWVMQNGVIETLDSLHTNTSTSGPNKGTLCKYVFIYPETVDVWNRLIQRYDICVNFYDPDRNGEYEPYVSHTYDLGTDTLRGLFKLDSNNNLYADGDRKTSDGVIARKYGIRAYQSGDESLSDAITDGINTVYKLVTPTSEQSTPFTNPQICDPDGTEEYVTSNGVPVGHETRYQL